MLVVLVACAQPASRPPDAPEPVGRDEDRYFAIWLGGARVGTAHERERWSVDGVTLMRREELQFLRGTTPVTISTAIEIAASPALVPTRVTWRQSGADPAEAIREPHGWTVLDHAGASALPADAIPAELVPMIVRRHGRFAGAVFFPARGFVVGRGQVEPVAPGRLVGRLALDGGTAAEATIDVAPDRSYTRVVDGEGVIAIRTTTATARAPFEPVDLVAATAIPIAGHGDRLVIDSGTRDHAMAMPPPLPGQLARSLDDGIELVLSPQLGGDLPGERPSADRTREIAALVADVRQRIAPDLAAGPVSTAAAASATKGDCTTYALAYAAHADRRAIPTRVVTGYRVDGSRLVRHRWAISWTGRAWIAIDVAFGAAPAGGDLVGLAVHAADDAGLVAGEAALAQVRAARWH